MKRAIFRLDAGKQTGFGHFMRCRALADALNQHGIECFFACKSMDENLSLSPHQLISLHNEDEFMAMSKNYALIIVDHYGYTAEEFYVLSRHTDSHLIVLDDEGNRGNLYADVIINSVGKSRAFTSYQFSPDVQLLLGPQYCLLGRDFQSLVQPDFQHRNTLVVTFGGSDVAQMTLPVIEELSKHPVFETYPIVVVTGASCPGIEGIERFCQQHHYEHRHNVQNMAQLLVTCKLALSAAGSTVFELACCGVPSVLAVVANNQFLAAREHAAYGWCNMVDCRGENRADELVKTARLMLQEDSLAQLSQTARERVDAGGAERVAEQLLKRL